MAHTLCRAARTLPWLHRLCSIHTAVPSSPGLSAAFRVSGTQAATGLPLTTGRERLVVLGTGWGAARLLRDIDPRKYDITCISQRNHMVFTPLLASTCVGTLETRAVCQAIADLQPALRQPQNFYYAGSAVAVNPNKRVVEALSEDGLKFFVEYDLLAIATGSQGSTFGIPGVEEHTHFLRDAAHGTAIRNQLMRNWNLANIPGRSIAERDRILHCIIVGGGPTGVEFAGELADFVNRDLARIDNDRARDMRITLIEANELLGSFDARLREYAARKLVKEGVHLVKGIVKQVRPGEIELTSGAVVPFGLCVWSTGVGPTPFTLSLPFAKTSKGRLAIDERLRVLAAPPSSSSSSSGNETEKGQEQQQQQEQSLDACSNPTSMQDVSITQDEENAALPSAVETPIENVFALGDCCANADTPLPALAQVAEQQGKYLAQVLNQRANELEHEWADVHPFEYKSLGSMATVGGRSAVLELNRPEGGRLSWTGFASWIAWRSAYLTRLGTFKARMFVATNWTMTLLFGRDISRW